MNPCSPCKFCVFSAAIGSIPLEQRRGIFLQDLNKEKEKTVQSAVSDHPDIHGSHARVARLHTEEGFGYLETADGREVLFQRACVAHDAFDQLLIGDEVLYVEELGQKGPQATLVQRVREPGRLEQA